MDQNEDTLEEQQDQTQDILQEPRTLPNDTLTTIPQQNRNNIVLDILSTVPDETSIKKPQT